MKRNPKSIPAFLLALVLAVSLVLPVGAAGSGITLDKTSATLAVGQTPHPHRHPPGGQPDAAITWASANEAIAALVPPAQGQPANTAVFRGMTAGTVTVTATAGGRTALCTITVAQDTPPPSPSPPPGRRPLPVGKTRQLTAQVNYTLGSAGNQNVVWSSSDPQVATVDRNGKVTAVAEGTATILAVSEAKDALGSVVTGEYALTVTPRPAALPDRLVLSAQQKRVEAGQGWRPSSPPPPPSSTTGRRTSPTTTPSPTSGPMPRAAPWAPAPPCR